jgi:hypothetical protein
MKTECNNDSKSDYSISLLVVYRQSHFTWLCQTGISTDNRDGMDYYIIIFRTAEHIVNVSSMTLIISDNRHITLLEMLIQY